MRRLNANGQLLAGQVTQVEMRRLGDRLVVKIGFEFVNPHQVTQKRVMRKEYPGLADVRAEEFMGKRVTVLYAADNCFVAL